MIVLWNAKIDLHPNVFITLYVSPCLYGDDGSRTFRFLVFNYCR